MGRCIGQLAMVRLCRHVVRGTAAPAIPRPTFQCGLMMQSAGMKREVCAALGSVGLASPFDDACPVADTRSWGDCAFYKPTTRSTRGS